MQENVSVEGIDKLLELENFFVVRFVMQGGGLGIPISTGELALIVWKEA